MAYAATQKQFENFLKLSAVVQRQVEKYNREEDARIQAALLAQAQNPQLPSGEQALALTPEAWKVTRMNAVNKLIDDEEWIAENYEGRKGAPVVSFRQIYTLVEELKPVMEQVKPMSAAQVLALHYACMAAGIV